ncbi:MAG TPA: NADH-quinone oxidoreductase subunit L [Bacteroidales bacterium]|nr:NADH-quinone oxidoreductase subunit L [Bacteroidales bacterium]
MNALLTLIPIFPFAGFLILALAGKSLPKKMVAFTGVFSVGVSALLSLFLGIVNFSALADGKAISVILWEWVRVDALAVDFSLRLDSLSMVFIFVITFVGFLIHLYSTEFMKDDDGYSRFFAYMNLFVSSMLILVLADNLLLLYLGWEGVGLCSYLLIGFWYKEPANGYAARKAFIVTRVGDVAMLIGLLLLFVNLGTLNIDQMMGKVSSEWYSGNNVAFWASLLLLGGAVGKSAQLPLQTWLPDAMAGPSPVSALIHAATMVTAGVYLIARTHILYELSPVIMATVAVIGALTLLIAGFSAFAQHDLKRILAYSTISQIGYMFLALGVGAWSAGIFHFMVHAFFKALLFLSAGVVILLLDDEHDIFKMGGLRKRMPVVFWTFLAGSASLSALPLITAGFYSKDAILWFSWASDKGNSLLWLGGVIGAFITSLYTFRMVFITFFGEMKTEPVKAPGKLMTVPLMILAVLSLIAGFVELPVSLGHIHLFSGFLGRVLPDINIAADEAMEIIFQVITAVISLSGIYLAYKLYYKKSSFAESFNHSQVNTFFLKGWQFDKLYDTLFVRPFIWLSEIDRNDFIDVFSKGIAGFTLWVNKVVSITQNGLLRWYVMALAIGIVVIITIMMQI